MRQSCCFLLLLTVLAEITPNSALTCYECTQPKGSGLPCEVNVESVQQTVCAPGFSCIKHVWTTMGSSVINRHCADVTCDQLRVNSTQFNTLELCETCSTDLCNTASYTREKSVVLLVTMLVLFSVI